MGRKKEAYTPAWIEQGKRVKELREKIGMSQERLSNELGYESPNKIYNCERGRSGLFYEDLSRLSKIFGVDIEYITGNQEYKNITDLIIKSKRICESLTPEYMKEHDTLANLLWRLGYDLTVFEIDNSNFVQYIKRHIDGQKDNEVEDVIKDCMIDYEILKAGFKK